MTIDDQTRGPLAAWLCRHEAILLAAIILLAAVARLVAIAVLHEPVESDAASYLEMARTILAPGPMRDIYGNAAFYSPGYPFALSAWFAALGVSVAAAQGLNLVLGIVATFLVHRLARRVSDDPVVALIAAFAFAVLIPAVAGTALLQRENLSVPLLLAFMLAVVALSDTSRPRIVAALAGLAYGAGLLAGASIVLTALAAAWALWSRRDPLPTMAVSAMAFALAAALPVVPWLIHVDRQLGRPVLTTNAPFNLYVGNNPAATGRFVSLRDTPVAAAWHPMRDRLGELGATDALGSLARDYIATHKANTAALAIRKLVLFWVPDLPDGDRGTILTVLRWADVVQYLLIAVFAAAAALSWQRRSAGERSIVVAIGLFWAIHAAAYVMPRYREPAMPMMLILAAIAVAPLLNRRRQSRVLAV